MTKNQIVKSPPTLYVIIDTNIFQHYAHKDLADQIISNLQEALTAGYQLALSDITFYEVIDGASPEKEAERLGAIGKIKRFPVNKSVLIAAGHMGKLYKDDQCEGANTGDKIIAATSVLTGSMIYTTNARDFPRPFFNEVASRILTYEEKRTQKVIKATFLKPDGAFISKSFNLLMQPWKDKVKASKDKEKRVKKVSADDQIADPKHLLLPSESNWPTTGVWFLLLY